RQQQGESSMFALVFGSILPWLLIAVGTWIGYQIVRQNGRILLRLESIEKQLGARTQPPRREVGGLSVGSVAPDFELPDLAGVRRKLSEFRDKNVLLIFFNPKCGFCTNMAADLAALPAAGDDQHAIPVVVTTGDAEENRKLVAQHGLRCIVLLQEVMEVASRFRAQGTPMGYRIDRAGLIASELTVGAESLLKLAAAKVPQAKGARDATNGSSSSPGQGDPSLARSRLNRDGLKPGTPAPEFQLPRLDGGELSLADFRGNRVLLVFSDPECGPCDELAPQLETIHRQRSDLRVLVVSRREAEANRAKAAKIGLTFPIVLQRQWEISLKYAMFATPIGYLVDERGVIASDVAVGVQPILALASEPMQDSHDEPESSPARKEAAWASTETI
ncbi:MAG TPA: redoxin domain-containing protein, partial [Planctomycetaceae bacterium]|nr:redoxin domain-containing protein [Planctomycetaceae bacterium]